MAPDTTRLYTHEQREKSRKMGRLYTSMAVAGRKDDAQRFLVLMLNALDAGVEANADKAFLYDTARGLHDAISNLVGGMQRELDAECLDGSEAEIDLTELNQLITTLEH